jgi:RimJ/RimL family protein N-acetyltransferase
MHPDKGVAVLRLNPRHRDDVFKHLRQLPEQDRQLRFGRAIRDGALRDYVDGIDFARDRVFGIYSLALELIGVAHLALDPQQQTAELGLSVDPACRGRGYGFALLQRGVLHAANLGYRALFMYCLADNRTMMHLARKAGLTVLVESGEAGGRLSLDRHAHGSPLRETLADQFALIDCLLKQQYLWLGQPGIQSTAPDATSTETADERRGTARAAKAVQGEVPERA